MRLIFATANRHKLEEVRDILGKNFELLIPADLGYADDIPETGDTLEYNALEKSRFVWEKFRLPCFSDDTGLEVNALNGMPGAFSARYAGAARDPKANLQLVLKNMEGNDLRTARFRCVVALVMGNCERLFEGKVEGDILYTPQGAQGFGYDPVFKPQGYTCSFAELDAHEKNRLSHRGKAIRQLADFLQRYEKQNQ
ncbi:MAG: RdgB/HAM1 family non-canonical purine NTP pyrophosphatase [Prevotellaceae bacterium]|nr:RdgB/HAM1 family non-canonical purine NTP pyrophosphatase [Prevotellaceae bacterium]